MAKYSRHQKPSEETPIEAMKIAKSRQRPGQTREQTKLIADGIKKGIDEFKRQQKAKQREQNKHLKKQKRLKETETESEVEIEVLYKQHWLPWTLLLVSWILFVMYLFSVSG